MDTSPTALFDSYEHDFKQLVQSIKTKLEGDAVNQRGEQRKTTLRRVEMELDEADEMVSQMEVEIQGMPQSVKSKFQARVKNNKAELARWKKTAKDLHLQSSRADLLSRPFTTDEPYSDLGPTSDRTRLLAGTELLEDGTRRLEDSNRLALETEALGGDILRNLRQQREQIENSRIMLDRADGSIDRASGTLKKMIRRMYQQRIITGSIIGVLLLLIGFILWRKLF